VESERVLSFYFTVSSIVAGGLPDFSCWTFLCPRANRRRLFRHHGVSVVHDLPRRSPREGRVLDLGAEFHVAQRHDRP